MVKLKTSNFCAGEILKFFRRLVRLFSHHMVLRNYFSGVKKSISTSPNGDRELRGVCGRMCAFTLNSFYSYHSVGESPSRHDNSFVILFVSYLKNVGYWCRICNYPCASRCCGTNFSTPTKIEMLQEVCVELRPNFDGFNCNDKNMFGKTIPPSRFIRLCDQSAITFFSRFVI